MADELSDEMAREVLRFFLAHPEVADSLEGLARWRLPQERVQRTVQETSKALDVLIGMGLLEELSTGGERKVYRLKQDRREDAKRILNQDLDPAGK